MVPRPRSEGGTDDSFSQARLRAIQDADLSASGQHVRPVTVEQILSLTAERPSEGEAAAGLLVGRLVTKHVPPRLWSAFIQDETGSIRVCILDPDMSHLGEVVGTTSWRLVVASSSKKQQSGRPSSSSAAAAEGAGAEQRYLEVRDYRVLTRKRRRREEEDGEGSGYTEGVRACGRAVAVSLVVSERSKQGSGAAPWVMVMLDVGGATPVPVCLEGQAAVTWHPFLRVGQHYHFPLLYEAGAGRFPVPGVLVCRADGTGANPPVPPWQLDEEEARPLLGAFRNGSNNRAWTPSVPALQLPARGPSVVLPHPSSLVMSYVGKIRGVHRNSLYELEPLSDGRRLYLLLAHDLPDLGAGLRRGATIRLDNVHPLCLWGQLQALGVCLYSQVRVLAFSDDDPAGDAAHYRLPESAQYSRYCLTLLEWSRRTRVSLRNKVLGGNKAEQQQTPPSWFEPGVVRPWSKRLGVLGHPDRSDPLSEVLLHACGRCPVALGGLAMGDDGRLSPPLPALPKISEVRRAAGDRLSVRLARHGWVALLRKSASSSSSRWRHAFLLHNLLPPPGHDEVEEEGRGRAAAMLQPAVALGWLSRGPSAGGAQQLLLEDVSGRLPLLVGDGPKVGGAEEAVRGTPPSWMAQLAGAVGGESSKGGAEEEEAEGPRQLVGVKVGDVRVLCQLVRPGAAAGTTDPALPVKLPLPGGGGDVVHFVPHLLTQASALITVPATTVVAEAGAGDAVAPQVQPLSRLLAALDVARVRAKQPIECPASWWVRVAVLAVREEADGRVLHLFCRDAQGWDVVLLRLPASAQHQLSLPLLPGCIVRLSGLVIYPEDTRSRKLTLGPAAAAGGGSFRVAIEGYRAVTPEDRRLALVLHGPALLTGAWPSEAAAEDEDEDPFCVMPVTSLSQLVPQDRVCCAVATVVASVMVFNKVQLVVRCSRCRSQHTRGSGLLCPDASVLEPGARWEVQCVVDDGTAQATVFADDEVAVRLLGLRSCEQQRIQSAAVSRSPAELDSWLRAEVFGQSGSIPRRLRRVRLTAREVLQGRGGKGDGGPRPTLTFRRDRGLQQSSSSTIADQGHNGGSVVMWSYHMPTLKALQVVDLSTAAECRRQAYLMMQQMA